MTYSHQENPVRFYGSVAHVTLTDRNGNKRAVTKIDAKDWPKIRDRHWSLSNGYVRAFGQGGGPKNLYLHRVIAGTQGTKMWTDHKNGDKLDNRRTNLRAVNAVQSQVNKRTKRGAMRAIQITREGKYRVDIGKTFDTAEEAQKWRDAVQNHIHGITFMTECGLWKQRKI